MVSRAHVVCHRCVLFPPPISTTLLHHPSPPPAAELSLGFAVNGVAKVEHVLRKGGMQEGQVILLTKSVGTGTLMAADMKGKAKGPWVANALVSMCLSNRQAALCLRDHEATR